MIKNIKAGPLLALLLCFSIGLQAQNSAISRYFDSYQNDSRFSRVNVSGRMFALFTDLDLDDPDQQKAVETMSKLEGMKALVGENVADAYTLFDEVSGKTASTMEELMSMSENGGEFRFYKTESGDKISEIVMVGYENQNFMLVSVTGDIDLQAIAELSQSMNIPGFENFEKLLNQ
ncbi:MAG: DUF4252 domain-containing protein [Bacteroidota bacterium]